MIPPSPVLTMTGLRKAFGTVQAVSDGRLTARQGEVMALLGANGAGKSTMMNLLGGLVRPDAGQISIAGQAVSFTGPTDAIRAGIAFVQQELSIFGSMTVAENVFAGAFPTRAGRIDRAAMQDAARALLAQLGATIDVSRPVDGLSTGDRQMVEIARALRARPRILIFDEPTSSLSAPEKALLHAAIRDLKVKGVAIIYISHFISDVFDICDRVTVMRNGQTIAERLAGETDQAEVVRLMLGEIGAAGRIVSDAAVPGPVALRVVGLTAPPRIHEAGFDLHRGEILGIWGLLGAGRTELVRGLLGLDGPVGGRIDLSGPNGLAPATPRDLRAVTAFVTEDRRGEGLLLPFSVGDNIALPNLDALSKRGVVQRARVRDLALRLIGRLSIKVSGPAQRAGTLSGGNQQKVVLAKWLAGAPTIMILDEPTRGLDLAAKDDILRLAVDLAGQGVAVLLISSELEELMRVSHRYLIVRERRVAGTLPGHATEAELIAALSTPMVQQVRA